MKSKEENVLELFYNQPKQWHFEELLKKSEISRPQLANWLKKFEKNGIIKHIKIKGKRPYYIHDFHNPKFDVRKRLFAMQKLAESGLLEHLASLPQAKAIIVFGSFTRSDWYENSDIDIFIYGKDEGFRQGKYELKLKRDIQIHNAKNKKELKKMNKLLPYIVSGHFIKGTVQDLDVDINAKP